MLWNYTYEINASEYLENTEKIGGGADGKKCVSESFLL